MHRKVLNNWISELLNPSNEEKTIGEKSQVTKKFEGKILDVHKRKY